jgi:hypothetical protein
MKERMKKSEEQNKKCCSYLFSILKIKKGIRLTMFYLFDRQFLYYPARNNRFQVH